MKQLFMAALILSAASILSGCETLKSTVSGPFIGMKKDADNIGQTISNAHIQPENAIKRIDDWIQRNMW